MDRYNLNDIRDNLHLYEGLRLDVYPDPVNGKPTVGYGHLITDADNLSFGDTITKEKAIELFENDIATAVRQAKSVEGWSKMNKDRQEAIIDLTYNMGFGWREKFPSMYGHIKNAANLSGDAYEKEWFKASNELKFREPYVSEELSKYFQQVGNPRTDGVTPRAIFNYQRMQGM